MCRGPCIVWQPGSSDDSLHCGQHNTPWALQGAGRSGSAPASWTLRSSLTAPCRPAVCLCGSGAGSPRMRHLRDARSGACTAHCQVGAEAGCCRGHALPQLADATGWPCLPSPLPPGCNARSRTTAVSCLVALAAAAGSLMQAMAATRLSAWQPGAGMALSAWQARPPLWTCPPGKLTGKDLQHRLRHASRLWPALCPQPAQRTCRPPPCALHRPPGQPPPRPARPSRPCAPPPQRPAPAQQKPASPDQPAPQGKPALLRTGYQLTDSTPHRALCSSHAAFTQSKPLATHKAPADRLHAPTMPCAFPVRRPAPARGGGCLSTEAS